MYSLSRPYSIYAPDSPLHRRLRGIYHGPDRPYGIRNGEPIVTTHPVKVSVSGRSVTTVSGSKYRLRFSTPQQSN